MRRLTIGRSRIIAADRIGACTYEVTVSNGSTRDEILALAREQDSQGRARVDLVEEDTGEPQTGVFPIAVIFIFGAHLMTMFLLMALMPLYIVLAINDERHDQSMRIIWVVLACTMGIFADPVYWYLYVWRKSSPQVALS